MPLIRKSGQATSFVFNLYEALDLISRPFSVSLPARDPAKFGLSGSPFRILPLGFSGLADCNQVFGSCAYFSMSLFL
jgi:hypothetical protein